jgi:hypothetical protein
MKYNKSVYSWTLSPGGSCSNKYDVQAVGTHERGHTFGMGHVSEADHANLTMSTQTSACQMERLHDRRVSLGTDGP